jgi:hypothetical protein
MIKDLGQHLRRGKFHLDDTHEHGHGHAKDVGYGSVSVAGPSSSSATGASTSGSGGAHGAGLGTGLGGIHGPGARWVCVSVCPPSGGRPVAAAAPAAMFTTTPASVPAPAPVPTLAAARNTGMGLGISPIAEVPTPDDEKARLLPSMLDTDMNRERQEGGSRSGSRFRENLDVDTTLTDDEETNVDDGPVAVDGGRRAEGKSGRFGGGGGGSGGGEWRRAVVRILVRLRPLLPFLFKFSLFYDPPCLFSFITVLPVFVRLLYFHPLPLTDQCGSELLCSVLIVIHAMTAFFGLPAYSSPLQSVVRLIFYLFIFIFTSRSLYQ